MAEKITWDGTNLVAVSLFVEKHVGLGALKTHYATGLSVVQYEQELPLPVGSTLVALSGGGVKVEAGEAK